MNTRTIAVALGAAALIVPASAAARSDHPVGKGAEHKAQHVASHERGSGRHKKAPKPVTFVFRGVYKGAGVVTVASGNAHARKGGFVGQDVTFDVASAKVVAAESDGVPGVSAGDLQAGDAVLVQARLPRGTKAAGSDAAPAAIVARKVVDKTHPPVVDGHDETEPAPAS